MNKYTVQMISSICKIPPHTLRAWEKRYQVVSPERTSGGQRLYSQDDLEKLQYLQRLVQRGHKISQLACFDSHKLRTFLEGDSQDDQINMDPLKTQRVEGLLNSLQRYELKELRQKLESFKLDFSIRGYLFHVVLPLFEKVGLLIEERKLNISQEHALSAIVRSSLLQINPPLIHPLPNRVIALATPEGNLHELGIIMGNILCAANQWETIYFGPNLPADALAESIQALEVPYLLLGGLYPGNVAVFRDYLKELDRNCQTHVILGGEGKKLQLDDFENITVEIKPNFSALETFLKSE